MQREIAMTRTYPRWLADFVVLLHPLCSLHSKENNFMLIMYQAVTREMRLTVCSKGKCQDHHIAKQPCVGARHSSPHSSCMQVQNLLTDSMVL